jgi:hypothetical protein
MVFTWVRFQLLHALFVRIKSKSITCSVMGCSCLNTGVHFHKEEISMLIYRNSTVPTHFIFNVFCELLQQLHSLRNSSVINGRVLLWGFDDDVVLNNLFLIEVTCFSNESPTTYFNMSWLFNKFFHVHRPFQTLPYFLVTALKRFFNLLFFK